MRNCSTNDSQLSLVVERYVRAAPHKSKQRLKRLTGNLGRGKAIYCHHVSEQQDLSNAGLHAFSNVFARLQLPPEEPSVSEGVRIALVLL